MDELNFSWPDPSRPDCFDIPEAPMDGAEVNTGEVPEFLSVHDEVEDLRNQLSSARRRIVHLEAHRSAARQRIEQLEVADEWAQAVITQQRRRLTVLERQVEDIRPPLDAEVDAPTPLPPGRTTWLDRLLGGTTQPSPSPSPELVPVDA